MKSIWFMEKPEEIQANFPIWEEGTKLAGKPVYLAIENWNGAFDEFAKAPLINMFSLQTIAGASPIANKDNGDWAVIIVNSAVEIDAKTMEFFMFHELGHIIQEHGTKRANEAAHNAGVMSCLKFEFEADRYAYEHTGYAINFKEKFSQELDWSFEKLSALVKTVTPEELKKITLANPELKARQDNIDALVKASVAS